MPCLRLHPKSAPVVYPIDFAVGYVAGVFPHLSPHGRETAVGGDFDVHQCRLIVVKTVVAADHVRLRARLLHDVG